MTKRIKEKNIGKNKKITINHLETFDPLTETQALVKEAYKDAKSLVLHGIAGTGKAQPLDSKVKVPGGWTTMRDIKVGDTIQTPSNEIATVVGKYNHYQKDIYKLTLCDGREVFSCDEHLWQVEYESGTKVVQLAKLIKDFDKSTRKRFYIPLTNAIEESEAELPIDPYVLGFLLGDGCFVGSTSTFTTADTEIVQFIHDRLDGYKVNKRSNKYEYSIVTTDKTKDTFKRQIKKLGLDDTKSNSKFIPEKYLTSSIYQRLELLQGLFDSDGTISKNSIEFCSVSKKLAEQVQYLIFSLGGSASITARTTKYTHKGKIQEGQVSYRVIPTRLPFSLKKRLFKLPRKFNKVSPGQYDNSGKVRIQSIEYVGKQDCACIAIDSLDKLYITDNFVVTHNTFLSIGLALEEILQPNNEYEKLVVVRSVVPTRDIGFLKGTDEEKIAVYEAPYHAICEELFSVENAYETLKNQGCIEFISTSFIRGLTFNNAIVLVDEFENLNFHELDSVITRIGKDCKVIFCGDYTQSDFTKTNERNGCLSFMKILNNMHNFASIEFSVEDIVRSDLVKEYIINKYKLGLNNGI